MAKEPYKPVLPKVPAGGWNYISESLYKELAARILAGLAAKPGFDATDTTLQMMEDKALDSAARLWNKAMDRYRH